MNLTKANNARLMLNTQDENSEILKVLGDAKGKIVFYYDDNTTKCFEIEKWMLADKITKYLKEHYVEHNKELDKELEDL